METTHNSVKVKLGIKVMELVESLQLKRISSQFFVNFIAGLYRNRRGGFWTREKFKKRRLL